MKKIEIQQERIFEIAKILKEEIPEEKIYLHQQGERIIIQLTKKIDRLKLEEIKSLIKIQFPDIEVVFRSNF